MKRRNTFIVEIADNQNKSWQGSIEWLQGKKKEYFRSTMELMQLMESAVRTGEEEENE